VWDRRSSAVDVSPLSAVTLARWGAVGPEKPPLEMIAMWA
jgi:hypothetical protein